MGFWCVLGSLPGLGETKRIRYDCHPLEIHSSAFLLPHTQLRDGKLCLIFLLCFTTLEFYKPNFRERLLGWPQLSNCQGGEADLSLSDLERVYKYIPTSPPLSQDSQLRWWSPLSEVEGQGSYDT